jgi:hypothetical protein
MLNWRRSAKRAKYKRSANLHPSPGSELLHKISEERLVRVVRGRSTRSVAEAQPSTKVLRVAPLLRSYGEATVPLNPPEAHARSHHCEPSISQSIFLRSSIMAASLLRAGSGMGTGSYRAAGIESFNASSSSQRALASFAAILLLSSWRSISLPVLGKEVCRFVARG